MVIFLAHSPANPSESGRVILCTTRILVQAPNMINGLSLLVAIFLYLQNLEYVADITLERLTNSLQCGDSCILLGIFQPSEGDYN